MDCPSKHGTGSRGNGRPPRAGSQRPLQLHHDPDADSRECVLMSGMRFKIKPCFGEAAGRAGGGWGGLGVFGVDSDTARQHELEWVPDTGVGPHGFVLFFSTFYVCLKASILKAGFCSKEIISMPTGG